MQLRMQLAFLPIRTHCRHVQPTTRTARYLFRELLLPQSTPTGAQARSYSIPSTGIYLCLCWTSRGSSAHSSSLLRSLPISPALQNPPDWYYPQPCKGLNHASPALRLLMKVTNRISSSVSLPGTSDCCQLDFQSLTTTTHPVLIFSMKICGYSAKSFAKFAANIHCFPLSRRAQHFTTVSIRASQAKFVFGKSLLAVPSLQSPLRVSLLLQHSVLNSPHFDKNSWDTAVSIVSVLP